LLFYEFDFQIQFALPLVYSLDLQPMAKSSIQNKVEIKNRRASFEYQFIDTFTAGIVLRGTEMKSIRMGKANISDAHCYLHKGELFIKNLHISPYEFGTHYNHEPLRERKLLLQRKELKKLENKLKDVGLTIIPTRLFISERGQKLLVLNKLNTAVLEF
jgi:SsrA-binding protein